MKPSHFHFSFLALTVLLFAGCESNNTIANRISEKSSTFTSLTPEQKSNLEDGMILPGYTADMAYIALGKPSSIATKQRGDITVEMWTYSKFYPSGKLAKILTEYSRARNPNLLRETNTNAAHVSSLGTATSRGNELSLPDLPVYNLYVFFHEGKIVDIKLDSLDATKL